MKKLFILAVFLFSASPLLAQLNCSGGPLNCPGTPTGTGVVVLQTSPTLTTPVLGVATGTSVTLTGGSAVYTGLFGNTWPAAGNTHGGAIYLGDSTASYGGVLGYDAAGNTTLYLDNINDNAAAAITLRTRTLGTPVTHMSMTGTTLTISDTVASPLITTPKITQINDGNGNVFLTSAATASAVDSFTMTNAATATLPTVTIAASGTDSNITTSINGKGTGLVTHGSIIQAPSNIVRLDNAFTDSNASGLQNITGLSWTMPANIAVIWPFHCRLVVNQNTAAVVDTIGIQDVTVSPTYIQATGVAETALTAAAFGDLGTGLASTTATGIISFTPGAIGTNLTVLIDGIISQPSNASSSVIQMMIQQATAADTIIVQKGSFCSFGGTS